MAGDHAGGLEMRTRAFHEAWLATLSCPVVRLEGDLSAGEQLNVGPTTLRRAKL